MRFGLTNALSTFMTQMDSTLHPYLGKFVVVFPDDIVVYSRFKEEHWEHLCKVFDLLQAHKLFAKESKREFFKIEVHYLGHIISHKGIIMDLFKVEAILNWPHPNNLEELQIFLGLLGFYHKFICNYAKIVVPMTNQLKAKGHNFFLGEKQQHSFDKLKVAIATTPILVVFDPHKPFVVETNASSTAIGAVLL